MRYSRQDSPLLPGWAPWSGCGNCIGSPTSTRLCAAGDMTRISSRAGRQARGVKTGFSGLGSGLIVTESRRVRSVIWEMSDEEFLARDGIGRRNSDRRPLRREEDGIGLPRSRQPCTTGRPKHNIREPLSLTYQDFLTEPSADALCQLGIILMLRGRLLRKCRFADVRVAVVFDRGGR